MVGIIKTTATETDQLVEIKVIKLLAVNILLQQIRVIDD